MKKGLLLVLAVVFVAFLVGNADTITNFVNTVRGGAMLPIAIAFVLMIARHVVQAQSYVAAFEAVDHHPTLRHEIILIFSLVFINTFCLFSGATGVAFIIDDARRDGADPGQSTSGAILSQIGYFAAVFVICVLGFITMLVSGNVNTTFLIGGLALTLVLAGLSSLFVIGHFRPNMLRKFFRILEIVLNKLLGIIKKSMKPRWGATTATSFINNANMLASNPRGTLITLAYASTSALLNMACLVAIGYAFGFKEFAPLMAAFALASVSVVVSPTPQGVGVVEAAIIMILTAAGCAVNVATAIALVYRGIMFWVPFVFGAVMLTQSGFFKGKKDAAQEQKDKDIAWMTGMAMGIIGIVNIVLNLASSLLQPYVLMTQLIDLGTIFPGWGMIVGGLAMIVLAFGLINRFRVAWAISLAMTIMLAGVDFFFLATIPAALFMVALSVWLFLKRHSFDQPVHLPRIRKKMESRIEEDLQEEGRVVRGLGEEAERYSQGRAR